MYRKPYEKPMRAKTQTALRELEGHSVEGIYLRQRSSDGSVNKTILKPRLVLAARYTWDFPDVKFRVAAQLAGSLGNAAKFRSLYDIGERKQSGSGIRTMIRIGLKS